MSNMDELRYLKDVANDPALGNARKKFKKGVKKCRKRLKRGKRKASVLKIKREWQRNISGNAIVKYDQFDPQLATILVVSVRPDHLGGDILLIDGQHTGMMDLLGECDHEHDTLELHHAVDASIEDVEKAEAALYKALNTQNKKLSKLDIIRVDLFLKQEYAIVFNNILTLCKLNIDGLGDVDGDVVPGSGTRFINTAEIYGEDYSHYINRAVSFMRDNWGTEDNPLKELRDDMIYGLTTLFVFLDKAGSIEGGSPNGLNGKKKKVLQWMNSEMCKTSMRKYTNNTAGGHVHFKVVYNIIQEYNYWADANDPTLTISKEYLHLNGIWDPTKFLSKEDKRVLPSFPKNIK